MALWLLTPRETAPWWGYDEYYGYVIRAATEEDARALADGVLQQPHPAWKPRWRDTALTSCEAIPVEGETAIILSNFVAG